MLYIIGLGLGDANDVTVKGAEAIKKSSKVFLEMYTAILGIDNDAIVSMLRRRRKLLPASTVFIFFLRPKSFKKS